MANFNTLVFGDNRTSDYNVTPGTLNSASGYIDDIRIYSQVISTTQILEDIDAAESCEVVDHYLIEHPASALTCDSPNITIKACANESCSTLSTVPSTIVLTPDSFDPSSTLTFTGQTQVKLNNQTAGTFTIGTSSQEPTAVVECSNNCEIEYESAGVQFFNKTTGQTNFDNSWFVAEDSFSNVGIKIVGDSGGTCEGLVDGQQDITMTYACVNKPSASYTPTQCNVPFAGIPLSGGSSQSGTISMTFDANGEADLSNYSFADAGILQLTASATINGAAVQAASVALNVVPSYLALASTSSTLIKAGNTLPFSITAYGASDNVLPGYQSNNLQMSAVRSIPNDTDAVDAQFYFDSSNPVTSSLNEVFSDISATFNNGSVTSNSAYFEEVGTYLINVRDNNYLGAQINAEALTLGRVIPDYFDVQKTHQPVLQNTCGSSFTYVGESFAYVPGLEPTYTLTAYNSRGQITQNYARALWRLDFDVPDLADRQRLSDTSVYSGDGAQKTAVSGVSVSGNDVYNGIATLTLNGLSYTYPKIVAPSGSDASPFAANFEYRLWRPWFTDADGVCYQTSQSGECTGFTTENIIGANMRYGRLNLENAFGPETEALAVPIYTEYLDQGQWRANTEDNCTAIALQQSAGDITVTHDVQSTVNLTSMMSNLSINNSVVGGLLPNSSFTVGPFLSGGEALSGSFYIELVPKSSLGHWSNHLNYDWDGDGDIDSDDKPAANITLGIYRGNERTLHWREVLN